MSELSAPAPTPAMPTRSHLNPSAPVGARAFRPRDVAYVVDVPNSSTHGRTTKRLVLTSDKWLRGWDVGKSVVIVTTGRVINGTLKGIMDFATVTREGEVPNVLLAHWRVENSKR